MVRVHVVSDLHVDIARIAPAEKVGDILIVAGDFTTGPMSPEEWTRLFDEYTAVYGGAASPDVFFVLGNHEFYGRTAEDVRQASKEHRTLVRPDVEIFGNTMWTDFDLYGPVDAYNARRAAHYGMSDYRKIEKLAPTHTLSAHRDFVTAYEKRMEVRAQAVAVNAAVAPFVCVTHHAPTEQSLIDHYRRHPIYDVRMMNAAYASNLERLMDAAVWPVSALPRLWVHGHVHASIDYTVYNTRVVANPRGYCSVRGEPENPNFDPNFTVDI